MAGRAMELLISLKGKLEKSLPESLRRTAAEVGELQKKMSRLNEIRVKAEKYKELERSAQSLGSKFSQATAKAAQLESELKNNRRAAAQYKAQLDQARAVLAGMSRSANPEAYKTARANLAQLTAAYKTAQATVKASERAFKQAASSAKTSGDAFAANQNALRRLSSELRQAGFYTEHFASSQIILQNELRRTGQALSQAQRIQAQYDAQQARKRENQKNFHNSQQDFYNATGNWNAGLEVSRSILSPFANAISVAMDFEAEMSKVKSMTQMDNIKLGNWEKVNSEMKMLTEQAKEMGRTTQFTSVQAAQAQFYMAKAGWDTQKVYEGLPPILNMAAVENMDLGRASEITTNIMSGFGKSADEVGHVVDVLAYTSTHANTDLNSLGETMKYAAPVAKSFGASLEETATMAKFMADAGITGSQAGTSLRQGLLRLVAPPKKASKAMQEMGISLSEAQTEWANANAAAKAYGINLDATKGPGEQLISVIKQIESGMAGASDQEKIAALNAITGINAVSGWAAVMANSSGSIEEFYQSLRTCDGAAAQAANTMQDNTKGAFTRFGSAAEAVAQNIGDVFLPTVREAAETAAVYATALAEWTGKHQGIVMAAGIAAAAVSGLIMTVLTANVAVSGWELLGTSIAKFGDYSLIAAVKAKVLAAANMATGKALSFLSSGTQIATAAQAALNAVMAMNPYVLAAIAIIALVGAIALLVANFDKLKETATIVFNHISGTVSAWAAVIQAKFAEALAKITEVWSSITGETLQSSEIIGVIINNLGFVLGAAFDIAAGIIGTAISTIINIWTSMAQIIGGVVNIIVGIFTGDWKRIWDGAGQAVEGFAGGTLGTIKTIAGGIGDIFDTLMGKSAEVQRQAEQAKAQQDLIAKSREAKVTADYMPDEGMMQTAQAAQQTAQATAEASAHAQTLSANVEQGGAAAQQTADYMKQLQEVMGQVPVQTQAAFSGMGEQSAAAAQAVNASMQQIPTQTQATFQQLPPMAQQGTDAMVQEFSQIATKCQPGGEAFVQAANGWGQQAYDAIANWSDQMAHVVVDKLSNAWAQISAQFSAGLDVNVTTTGGGSISHNAEGGIYRKGAFLTTFAEDSAEAAIPLDGSGRAVSLWRQAGELLGILPKNTGDIQRTAQAAKDSAIPIPSIMDMVDALPPEISTIAEVISPPTEAEMAAAPVAYEPTSMGGEAFVQAANNWGQQAYQNIANWSSQMAQVVVDKLSSAWAQISAQFSAGLDVNVTTTGGGSISHNAEGGIYRKGAFLTTFAENSAEAAIPLDGSGRAVSLWRQAGELLGILPKNTGDIQRTAQAAKDSAIPIPSIMDMVDALPPEISTIAEVISPPTEAEMAAAPVAYEPTSTGGDIEVNFNPQITIQGNADSGTVSQMGDMLSKLKAELMREVRREFGNMKADFEHQERRRSYAT